MRSKANRVYTSYITQALAANTVGGGNVLIPNNNRNALLKSVSFDIRIETGALNDMLPLEQNFTQEFFATLFAFPGSARFALPVEPQAGFAGVVGNGTNIRISKPGQYKFDSFYIQNNMMLTFSYINHDLLLAVSYEAWVSVELEDVYMIQ